MPASRKSPGGTAVRHVAPFAPLAIALLMNRAVLPGSARDLADAANANEVTAVQCDDVVDFQDCHSRFPTGCSKAGRYDAYLNLLKNQLIPPSDATGAVPFFLHLQDVQALDHKMPATLGRNNHADFKDQLNQLGETQLHGVIGYLYYAQKTGAESSNCQLDSTDGEGSNVDYHIGIGFDSGVAESLRDGKAVPTNAATQTSMIVEMTPHYRFAFENNVWTLANVKAAIGKQVRVVGQLIVDSEHNIPSQNCALATTTKQLSTCWRGSVWELHPVVTFQVCESDTCTENSAGWSELGSSRLTTAGNQPLPNPSSAPTSSVRP